MFHWLLMGMYDVTSFPQDSEFWQLIAFCAGTGGSMLIIGSAAGVAFMEDGKGGLLLVLTKGISYTTHKTNCVDKMFVRTSNLSPFLQISGFAFAGYAAGIVPYLALHNLNISLPTLAEVPFLSGS